MAKIPHIHTEPVVQATVYAVVYRKIYGGAILGLAAGFVLYPLLSNLCKNSRQAK